MMITIQGLLHPRILQHVMLPCWVYLHTLASPVPAPQHPPDWQTLVDVPRMIPATVALDLTHNRCVRTANCDVHDSR